MSVADMLLDGDVSRDSIRRRALKTLEVSCEEDGVNGCLRVGLIHLQEGRPGEARRSFQRACASGVSHSCGVLDELELETVGNLDEVCKDDSADLCLETTQQLLWAGGSAGRVAAVRALTRLCNREKNRPACIQLGYAISRGYGHAKDLELAVKILEFACQGEPRGCVSLGLLLQSDDGVYSKLGGSLDLFLLACNERVPMGCFLAGKYYEERREFFEAKRFLDQACDSGFEDGCTALSRSQYVVLEGTPESP